VFHKDKAREDWMKTLDQITALNPAILVPGHEGPGAKHDLSAIAFMKKYIADWDKNVAASKDAAEMRSRVLRRYPGLGMEFTLNHRVAAFFPDPAKKQIILFSFWDGRMVAQASACVWPAAHPWMNTDWKCEHFRELFRLASARVRGRSDLREYRPGNISA
jgi:hypothetical protein